MPTGLQVFDASGNVITDETFRWLRIHTTVQLDGSNQSGSVVVSTLNEGDFVWFAESPDALVYPPNVSLSGTTVNWSQARAGQTFNGRLHLGSY